MEHYDTITSLAMYTSLCHEDVVGTREIADESAGIYPCYYYKTDAGLCVSTSVARLIRHKGSFRPNTRFKPGNWKLRDVNRLAGLPLVSRLFKKTGPVCDWYGSHETVDENIWKVKPFEVVTFEKNENTAPPHGAFISDSEFVEKAAHYIQKFINDIEAGYPDHSHIVLAGGKDSQLILLADKVEDARWSVFSSEPNAPIVKQWIKDNDISINRIYEHDGKNEETGADLSEKIIAGDLFANPRHMRWLPTLKKVGASLGGKCFFWSGTLGDTLMAFNKNYHRGSVRYFYDAQFSRGVSWQGNSLQVHKNFTGCPCLSPYHSKEIWDNVFFRYDYAALKTGVDFRDRIGNVLAGRHVRWPASNPAPPLYAYKKNIDMYRHYVRCIRTALLKNASC